MSTRNDTPSSPFFKRLGLGRKQPDMAPQSAPAAADEACACLHKLLTHKALTADTLEAIGDTLRLPFESASARFITLCVRIDQYRRHLQATGIQALAKEKETLQTLCEKHFRTPYHTYIDDEAIGILMTSDALFDIATIKASVMALDCAVKEACTFSVTVGVGTHAMAAREIAESYRNANIASRYRYIFGYGQCIDYEDIRMRVGQNVPYPSQVEKSIIDAMKKGDIVRIEQEMTLFFELVGTGSVHNIPFACTYLCMRMHRALPEDIHMDDDLAGLHVALSQCEHWSETMRVVLTYGVQHTADPKELLDKRYESLIEGIVSFIAQNYPNPDLSVVSVAEHLDISQSLVRHLLKIGRNITPRDFILSLRMDKACDLLRETDLTAKMIAEQVGYKDSRYFYNVFKRYTGFTAYEYRNREQVSGPDA